MFQWLIIARLCVSVGCRELANEHSGEWGWRKERKKERHGYPLSPVSTWSCTVMASGSLALPTLTFILGVGGGRDVFGVCW